MATKENQTLQIALMVFALLVVLMTGLTYYFWKSYSDSQQEVAALQSKQSEDRTAVQNKTDEANTYKTFMGFQAQASPEDIKSEYDSDMDKYAASFEEGMQNYRNVIGFVDKEAKDATSREADAKQQLEELKQKHLALEQQSKQRIDQFEGTSNTESKDAAKLRAEFQDYRQELEQARQDLLNQIKEMQAKYEEQIKTLEDEKQQLAEDNTNKARRIETLLEERPVDHAVFEHSDGEIRLVNQSRRIVFINKGYKDGLREQIKFAVYDRDLPVASEAEPKAKIEVTRILRPDLAEAAIIDSDPANPILRGDHIYNVAWDAGKKVRFAFAGFIDIDGDGQDDMERVQAIVRTHGALVDAYVDPETGDVEGEISVETRFLVEGEEYSQGDPEARSKRTDSRTELLEQAASNSVDRISVDKFLSYLGWKHQKQTVPLGAGANGDDFIPEIDGGARGVSTGTTVDMEDAFRRRTPRTPF